MRILHVITSLKTGGAERLMVDLLPLIRDKGQHVVELLVFDGIRTPFLEKLEEEGIKIITLSKDGNVYNPMNVFRLVRYISSYDLIHTHNTACQLFVPIAKMLSCAKTVLVTTEHNTTNRRRDKIWFKPIDRWMYNQYATTICISEKASCNLKAYIGDKHRIVTVFNGIDTKRFIRPVKNISSQNHYVVAMVAGFRPQKDQDTLLKSFTFLPDNYKLQLVGSGQRESQLKVLCRDLNLTDRVDFMGVRQDVPDILEQSDIVVLSSHWEGLSLSSIEGMASGRPFVASDVDGLHEMVSGAGVLFEHGNDKVLAEKIQWLCEHPDEYRKVAQCCQDKARQYDISVMAEKYLKLYNRLLYESR